ncbi:hypothetical protein [Aeromonas sp. ASNIH6]|uniref:hypothetical protein n=1 Tax=Aeromonas sp. ASNIH6 TaxID=1758188 RepID=UPI000CDD44C3|nr:hypothetical protein [Aeromonas sp. ASNIH6]POV84769.1 hypothetical protein C3395_25755 [Aeromonas sp. ASNIH6]
MSNENHQLFTTEQIRQRLEEGGESARWLAQAVVAYYRPAAPATRLVSVSTKMDEEAQGMFCQMLLSRSKPDWSDDQRAALVRECEQYLAN